MCRCQGRSKYDEMYPVWIPGSTSKFPSAGMAAFTSVLERPVRRLRLTFSISLLDMVASAGSDLTVGRRLLSRDFCNHLKRLNNARGEVEQTI